MLESVLLIALAAAYLITAWLNGSIFACAIQWLKDDMLVHRLGERLGDRGRTTGEYLTLLLLCPLCLAPYVCFVLFGLLSALDVYPWNWLIPIQVFCAAALATFLHLMLVKSMNT